MTTRFTLTSVAALALALVASAPAMAGCHASTAIQNDGYGNEYHTRTYRCAQWGIVNRSDDSVFEGDFAGEGSRALSYANGNDTGTRLTHKGRDNHVITRAGSGSRISIGGRGDGNDFLVAARNGSRNSIQNYGSGNSYNVNSW